MEIPCGNLLRYAFVGAPPAHPPWGRVGERLISPKRTETRSRHWCRSWRKLVFNIFAALAAFEWGLIIERTRAGTRAARARGVRPGPKPKLGRQQIDHARELIEAGKRREDVADLFNVSRVTLYRALTD